MMMVCTIQWTIVYIEKVSSLKVEKKMARIAAFPSLTLKVAISSSLTEKSLGQSSLAKAIFPPVYLLSLDPMSCRYTRKGKQVKIPKNSILISLGPDNTISWNQSLFGQEQVTESRIEG